MSELDGTWNVRRLGGALPPMVGLRKTIRGSEGETTLGPFIRARFRVDGTTLRYLPPLSGFVDELEPDGARYLGRATFRGREYGRFALERQNGEDSQAGVEGGGSSE